jgi:hypothetical protein
LSDEGDQLSVTVVAVIVPTTRFDGVVGGTMSRQAAVETPSDVFEERAPAAFTASTDTW